MSTSEQIKQTTLQAYKQTIQDAISELNGELNQYQSGYKQCLINMQNDIESKLLAQEREQIEDAYRYNSIIRTISKAEHYYNETYGGDK